MYRFYNSATLFLGATIFSGTEGQEHKLYCDSQHRLVKWYGKAISLPSVYDEWKTSIVSQSHCGQDVLLPHMDQFSCHQSQNTLPKHVLRFNISAETLFNENRQPQELSLCLCII